jgi:hypothetical protein
MPQITASWRIGVIGVIDGGQRLIACVSGRLGGARDGARATSEDASSAPIAGSPGRRPCHLRGCLERTDRQRRFASRHRYHWNDTGMTWNDTGMTLE